jgi:ribosomal RNA-processing protein 12
MQNRDADQDAEALGSCAVKLLPILFKFVSETRSLVPVDGRKQNKVGDSMEVENERTAPKDSQGDRSQQVQSVSEAISSLSRHAPEQFLHGLFKKLMHLLLEEIQSESGDSERICSLLSLSQSLVTSQVLDEPSISFLYRALKPLIRNDEHGPRVQKRAYKVLAEICERYHSFVIQIDRLQELTALLTGTIMTSQISARHLRLKCINMIIEGFDESGSEHLVRKYAVSVAIPRECLFASNACLDCLRRTKYRKLFQRSYFA